MCVRRLTLWDGFVLLLFDMYSLMLLVDVIACFDCFLGFFFFFCIELFLLYVMMGKTE